MRTASPSQQRGCSFILFLYPSLLPHCPGFLSDGHAPNNSYLPNLSCEWIIKRLDNESLPVRISFSVFALETGFDYLRIFDMQDPSWLVASLTGTTIPPPVVHPRAVRVVFQSGASTREYIVLLQWCMKAVSAYVVCLGQPSARFKLLIFSCIFLWRR